MDYNKMIEEMEKEIQEKRAIVSVLETMQREIQYHMITEYDENMKPVCDENGNIIRKNPSDDDYEFPYYIAWKKAISQVEKLLK